MLWTISLFTLKPGASLERWVDQLASGLREYEAFLESCGQRFLGLYRLDLEQKTGSSSPSVALSGTCAEVCLVEGASASTAALREVEVPRTAGPQSWLNDRWGFVQPEGRVRLWLQPLGLSPLTAKPFILKDLLLHLTLRHLPANKTVQKLAEFDQRIIAHYAAHMLQARWYHIGTFHVFGLPEYMYVDTLDAVDAAGVGEALANDATLPLTDEMKAIYEECDLFVDRDRERYQLWLTPVLQGRAAQAGLRLD